MRVGIVYWQVGDGLTSAVSNTIASLGHEAFDFMHDAKVPAGLDVVLALGPFGSLVPLAAHLLAIPAAQRPKFALWMTEQLWNPKLPEWLGRTAGTLRSRAERFAVRETRGQWSVPPRWRWLTAKAFRFRYYGDLLWLRRLGLLNLLAIPSDWLTDFLRRQGFDAISVFLGSHPTWGADGCRARDVPVLWIGTVGSRRRSRSLRRIRKDLRNRGVSLLVVDGIEQPAVFGPERADLFTRTKVVVNLLRKSWDSNALRYYLAAPNRALIVTEPTLAHTAFVDGVHLIEVPLEKMAETICYYLQNEERRQHIAEQAYQLVTNELTMAHAVARVLDGLAYNGPEGNGL